MRPSTTKRPARGQIRLVRTRTEEVAMSIQDSGSTGKAGVKTLAIRLEPETHAQLSLIAQLRGNTITDEIKAALESHIAGIKTMPDLAARAGSVLEDIEREALARRTTIATLFGDEQPAPVAATATPADQAEPDGGPATGGPATAGTTAAEPSARSPRGRKEAGSSGSGSAVKDS
jgi:predicted DNA-binding protein